MVKWISLVTVYLLIFQQRGQNGAPGFAALLQHFDSPLRPALYAPCQTYAAADCLVVFHHQLGKVIEEMIAVVRAR